MAKEKEYFNSLDGQEFKLKGLTKNKAVIHVALETDFFNEQAIQKIEQVAGVKTHNINRALKYGIISLKIKDLEVINQLRSLTEVATVEIEQKQLEQ